MKYKLLIFDFDGTLADSFQSFGVVINQLADLHQFKRVEESDVDLLRSSGVRQIMQHLKIPYWKTPLIGRDAMRLMSASIDQVTLFDGIEAVLQRLSAAGVTLAIITSNSQENVERVLGPENTALIKFMECGSSLFGKRPKIRKVLKKSGFQRSETLCIGDELRDLEAAHEEGIDFAAVAWGYTLTETLRAQKPKVVFERVGEILEVVLG